jgi:iron complex transport system permease protein
MTAGFATTHVQIVRSRLAERRQRVQASLALLLVISFALAMYLGDYPLSPLQVLTSLFSPLTGQVDRAVDFIVLSVRLPRATLAVLTGVAFGLSGIIFQTLLRNALATPDIIGISHGSSAAAVACIILFNMSGVAVSLGAFGGAILVALAIYGLAWRDGVTPYRIVLIGIAVAAMMTSIVSYLFTRARLQEVQQAYAWLVGSLNAANLGDILPLAGAMLVLLPITAVLSRGLDALQLGDDTARALGARVEFTRLGLIVTAVAYAAFATAAVGPVHFVAFVAGPIARSLLGGAGRGFVEAALVGAVVMLCSDMVAQHALPDTQLPVGVVTGLFGAIFLLWLLVGTNRSGRVN